MHGLILPLVAGLVGAGVLGLWLGMRALPPTETAIIEAQAARYVAETGGAPTDCAARPAAIAGVRLIVTCRDDWVAAVDALGRVVTLPDLGPRT
ncbi:hypothetical protein LSUCC0031_03945 [Rhodobacterales bacterium LSUCC0031]|nr:hypothetical protein [Rhodobacterales bacterium LSUCC0031]